MDGQKYGQAPSDTFLGLSNRFLDGPAFGAGVGVTGMAGMANAKQDAPNSTPPVVARLEEMDKTVEVLKDELLTLVSRLQPFMRPPTPKPDVGETKSRDYDCEMEAKLAHTCTSLRELIYMARSARDALCI